MSSIDDATHNARVDMRIRLSRFNLPPVQSALVVGKQASIGSRAIGKALDEMMPHAFQRFEVEHPLVEAVLIREAHLRGVPAARLLPVLLRHAEGFMTASDTLHFEIDLEVLIRESFEL